jgi:hypothetical protein
VLERAVRRIDKHLRRHGLLDSADPDAKHEGAEDKLAASAVTGQVPPAGPQWLRGLSQPRAAPLGYDKPLCASLDGFTLTPPRVLARSTLPGARRCCAMCCARRSRNSGWSVVLVSADEVRRARERYWAFARGLSLPTGPRSRSAPASACLSTGLARGCRSCRVWCQNFGASWSTALLGHAGKSVRPRALTHRRARSTIRHNSSRAVLVARGAFFSGHDTFRVTPSLDVALPQGERKPMLRSTWAELGPSPVLLTGVALSVFSQPQLGVVSQAESSGFGWNIANTTLRGRAPSRSQPRSHTPLGIAGRSSLRADRRRIAPASGGRWQVRRSCRRRRRCAKLQSLECRVKPQPRAAPPCAGLQPTPAPPTAAAPVRPNARRFQPGLTMLQYKP